LSFDDYNIFIVQASGALITFSAKLIEIVVYTYRESGNMHCQGIA
jgi:hypothetical protein